MAEKQKEDLAEGTLLSHLIELRGRLFKMLGSVFVVFVALLPFAKPIFNYVAAPLVSVIPNRRTDRAKPGLATDCHYCADFLPGYFHLHARDPLPGVGVRCAGPL